MPMAPTAVPTPCDDLRIAVRVPANVLSSFLGPDHAGSLMWDPGHVGATLELKLDARWSAGRAVIAQDVV